MDGGVYCPQSANSRNVKRTVRERWNLSHVTTPGGAPHLGDSASVEILVPESEVDEANEIIAASFG